MLLTFLKGLWTGATFAFFGFDAGWRLTGFSFAFGLRDGLTGDGAKSLSTSLSSGESSSLLYTSSSSSEGSGSDSESESANLVWLAVDVRRGFFSGAAPRVKQQKMHDPHQQHQIAIAQMTHKSSA